MDERTKWLMSRGRDLRFRHAGDPDTPVAALYAFADDEDSVRMSLAGNSALPRELMERLAADSYWMARMLLTTNPAVPVELITPLVDDPHKIVSWAAAKRVDEEERRAWRARRTPGH